MKKALLLVVVFFQFVTFEVHAETVVTIHGFLSNAHSLKKVNGVLLWYGYEVCVWEYPSRQKFIKEHASDLVALLQELSCKSPGEPISFVTHSIGALILRAAVNMPNCPEEAKCGRAVLLAPPNQGTFLARKLSGVFPISFAMGSHSGWELMHYDARQFACLVGEFPPSMRVLVLAGTKGNRIWFDRPNDGLLTVDETVLNTPFCFASFPVTHGELLTNREALSCIRNFLLKTEPARCELGCQN